MSQNAPSGGSAVALKTGKKAPKHRSNFNLSYRHANTVRYGFVTPFFKFDGVPGDKVSLRSAHSLRTLSLKSPLFQNLRMNKDFYAVPMKALLPLNWDKLYNNPIQGDDIDPQRVNTLLPRQGFDGYSGGMYAVASYLVNLSRSLESSVTSQDSNYLYYLLSMLLVSDCFAGKGNLFELFRIDPWFGTNRVNQYSTSKLNKLAWDAYNVYIEQFVSKTTRSDGKAQPYAVTFLTDLGEESFTKVYDLSDKKQRFQLYYDFCDQPYVQLPVFSSAVVKLPQIASASFSVFKSVVGTDEFALAAAYTNIKTNINSVYGDNDLKAKYCNIAPILAYQMVMAEYFTNDKVDFVYNSDMWRQVMYTYGILKDVAGNPYRNSSFDWNGKEYSYDALSAVGINNILSNLSMTGLTMGQEMIVLSLISELFGYRRNLKYIDYFTGSRTRPIAVGDLNVQVTGDGVDVVDITRHIQLQRFLNQINRVGPDAKNYLKGLFDVEERQHIDVPVKIGHIDETVYGEEVQNTSAVQLEKPQSITTNLKSRGENFAFEFKLAESTIVLGLVSFSIRRFYNEGVDPFSMKFDRFDMFNPYLQFTGDQPIYVRELAADADANDVFGYTGRYGEYKNSVDYATGDFKDTLKTWIFSDTTNREQSSENFIHISPEFIRQDPVELDDFYLNMTGNNPGDRYHFICVFDNKVDASRDMVFNPQILG